MIKKEIKIDIDVLERTMNTINNYLNDNDSDNDSLHGAALELFYVIKEKKNESD
jgi:hypothetical protein